MSRAADLLRKLRDAGVQLEAEDDRLRVEGPAAVLTPTVYQQIVYFKEPMLELLGAESLLSKTSSATEAPAPPVAEAPFAGGVRARVRRDTPSRFYVWIWTGVRWQRRADSVSPSADHARRMAEHWYGPPLAEWCAVEWSAL
jgi:hypothetical protein